MPFVNSVVIVTIYWPDAFKTVVIDVGKINKRLSSSPSSDCKMADSAVLRITRSVQKAANLINYSLT